MSRQRSSNFPQMWDCQKIRPFMFIWFSVRVSRPHKELQDYSRRPIKLLPSRKVSQSVSTTWLTTPHLGWCQASQLFCLTSPVGDVENWHGVYPQIFLKHACAHRAQKGAAMLLRPWITWSLNNPQPAVSYQRSKSLNAPRYAANQRKCPIFLSTPVIFQSRSVFKNDPQNRQRLQQSGAFSTGFGDSSSPQTAGSRRAAQSISCIVLVRDSKQKDQV